MEKVYDFDATICKNSVFQFKKMDEKDLELFRHFNIKQWNNDDFEDELILKYGKWIISKNRDMFLKGLGGGSFEVPEMYDFVFGGCKLHIECGGGGASSRIFKHNPDGSYDEELIINRIYYTNYDENCVSIDIYATIAEAFAIYSFKSTRLNRFSVKFLKS